MSLISAIRAMLEAGLTVDQALTAAEALEANACRAEPANQTQSVERRRYEGPVTPRLPEREWLPLSGSILRRDGHVCRYCGTTEAKFCVDHVVPLSRGGSNDPDNLVVACIPCNSSKCDRLLSEWRGRYVD